MIFEIMKPLNKNLISTRLLILEREILPCNNLININMYEKESWRLD